MSSKWIPTKKLQAKHKPRAKRSTGYNMLRSLGAFKVKRKKGGRKHGHR